MTLVWVLGIVLSGILGTFLGIRIERGRNEEVAEQKRPPIGGVRLKTIRVRR